MTYFCNKEPTPEFGSKGGLAAGHFPDVKNKQLFHDKKTKS